MPQPAAWTEGGRNEVHAVRLADRPGTIEDREPLRPIGRNNERFQMMIDEVRKLALFADDAGFDCFSTTEHHFHSEGYEASVAPLLLYADLAARTKQIKFAPLGLVLPAWDPLRAAEEIADPRPPDQGPGLRRLRPRLPAALGQRARASSTSDRRADGRLAIDTAQPASPRGEHRHHLQGLDRGPARTTTASTTRCRSPTRRASARWPVADWTRKYGAPGEVDDEGVIRGSPSSRALPAAAPAGCSSRSR